MQMPVKSPSPSMEMFLSCECLCYYYFASLLVVNTEIPFRSSRLISDNNYVIFTGIKFLLNFIN